MRRTLVPDLVLDAHGAHSGIGVTIEDGRVCAVGPTCEGERLPGRALMPGFLNDHSHAFQRLLRGRVEHISPQHPHDDFWTWREQMYALAGRVDADSIRSAAETCFREMLSAGYTSVTEFHYVHHNPDGTAYAEPNAMAHALAEAAEAVGIRMRLVPAAYVRGGIERFRDQVVETFLARVDALRVWAEHRPGIEIGVAAHSVRAVPEPWLKGIATYARERALKLYVHADEQPGEIESCLAEYGMRPIEVLARAAFLTANTVVVHATHANRDELDLLAEGGCGICACPTTEGNLGDGFLPAEAVLGRGIHLSIGSDQNVRIDPLEELRELETNARRLAGRRNVLIAPGEHSPVPYLLRAGWQREGLAAGQAADMAEVDLAHPALRDVAPEDLTGALVFGAGRDVIAATYVNGDQAYRRDG